MALIMGAEYKREMRRLQMLFCMLLLAAPVLAFQETSASELTFTEAAGSQRWRRDHRQRHVLFRRLDR
jgi:hypothetical protein